MKVTAGWRVLFFVLAVFVLSNPGPAQGQVPELVTYQGKLTDKDGTPLNGSYEMSFYIYDYVQSADTPVWSDQSVMVQVAEGIYNVQLGLNADVCDSDEIYLEVRINHPGTGWETLSPRQRLTSTPFALKAGEADTLDGKSPDAFVQTTGGTMTGPLSVPSLRIDGTSAFTADENYNTFLGLYAGAGNVSASDNTFIGGSAGYNQNGEGNTFIGSSAGYMNVSGIGNIFIGKNAGHFETGSNRLYIDNSSTSDPLIWGDFQTDLLKINGSAIVTGPLSVPSLQINGTTFLKTENNNTFVGLNAGVNNVEQGNTFLGFQTGFANASGYSNTFIGNSAGYSNTEGETNVFIGAGAGYANETGASNTFIGYEAGNKNISGQRNMFIGEWSGLDNTVGSDNIFIGAYTGRHNTEGDENIFLGTSAGRKNTEGTRNTFVGYQAGYENLEAQSNTFMGYKAGYANVSGEDNTFMGDGAGLDNETGGTNTFIGRDAGRRNLGGSSNTLVGAYSGEKNTGSGNTFVGRQTGRENELGSGNVFLGDKAGYKETASNKLYIDNSDTSTPLIWGDFANDIVAINGKLGIGKTNPSAKLEVFNTSTILAQLATSIDGVLGKSDQAGGSGVAGVNSSSGNGIYGRSDGGGFAGKFDGNVYVGGNLGIGTTDPQGKLDVHGAIYQSGTELHADYVFEDEYSLESIEDHAEFMWTEKHLKAVPRARKDESGLDIVEYGSHMRGILEELEKAHVYIAQLNESVKKQEVIIAKQQEMITKLLMKVKDSKE